MKKPIIPMVTTAEVSPIAWSQTFNSIDVQMDEVVADATNEASATTVVQDQSVGTEAAVISSSAPNADMYLESEEGHMGFFIDATPSRDIAVSLHDPDLIPHEDESPSYDIHFESTKVEQPPAKKSKKSQKAKKKIIRGDDIYLGTDDDDDDIDYLGQVEVVPSKIKKSAKSKQKNKKSRKAQPQPLQLEDELDEDYSIDEDDDVAIMRDYMENVMTIDSDGEERIWKELENPDEYNYEDLYDAEDDDAIYEEHLVMNSSEEGNDSTDDDDDSDEDFDDDFDYYPEQDEISPDAFQRALRDALNDVPPSLQKGNVIRVISMTLISPLW